MYLEVCVFFSLVVFLLLYVKNTQICDMKAIVGNHERYIRNSLRSDSLVSRNSFRSSDSQHQHASHNASPSYSSGNESGGLQRRFTFKGVSLMYFSRAFCFLVVVNYCRFRHEKTLKFVLSLFNNTYRF